MKAVPADKQSHTPFTINNLQTSRTLKGLTQFLSHIKIAVFKVIQAHSASRLQFYNIL